MPQGESLLSKLFEPVRIEDLNLSLFGETTFLGKLLAPLAAPKRALLSKRRQLRRGFSSEGVLGAKWELMRNAPLLLLSAFGRVEAELRDSWTKSAIRRCSIEVLRVFEERGTMRECGNGGRSGLQMRFDQSFPGLLGVIALSL